MDLEGVRGPWFRSQTVSQGVVQGAIYFSFGFFNPGLSAWRPLGKDIQTGLGPFKRSALVGSKVFGISLFPSKRSKKTRRIQSFLYLYLSLQVPRQGGLGT